MAFDPMLIAKRVAGVQKMLKTQQYVLEYDYLIFWANNLGLTELLNQALEAAGLADRITLPTSKASESTPLVTGNY